MKEQIREATGDELSKLAGEVLYDNPQHQWIRDRQRSKGFANRYCSRCNLVWFLDSSKTCDIKLTWPEAMKWSEWAIEKYGLDTFSNVLNEMGLKHRYDVIILTIEQRITAACLCKLGKA